MTAQRIIKALNASMVDDKKYRTSKEDDGIRAIYKSRRFIYEVYPEDSIIISSQPTEDVSYSRLHTIYTIFN